MVQNKTHRATAYRWFITISSYNSGLGLSEESIARVTERLDGLNYKAKFLVNEHKNKFQQTFEHLHFYFEHDKQQSQDNVHKKYIKILKDLGLYNHKKDITTKPATHPAILIGGYLAKDTETTILMDTLEKGFKDYCTKEAIDYSKRVCILKGRKCPTLNEAHLTIYEFIQRHKHPYDTSLTQFKEIIRQMIKSHEYSLTSLFGKLAKVKTSLDVEYYDDQIPLFDTIIEKDHAKESDHYECKNMHIEHNTITEHHHPLPEEPMKPMQGKFKGHDHVPILSYDDQINADNEDKLVCTFD